MFWVVHHDLAWRWDESLLAKLVWPDIDGCHQDYVKPGCWPFCRSWFSSSSQLIKKWVSRQILHFSKHAYIWSVWQLVDLYMARLPIKSSDIMTIMSRGHGMVVEKKWLPINFLTSKLLLLIIGALHLLSSSSSSTSSPFFKPHWTARSCMMNGW